MNIDSGTGRARGASVFGPPAAAGVIRELLKPFEDIGVMGASATSSRATGGTDSTSFNNAGLAGIGWGQDPIEYQSATWHTNLDTYERIIEQDAKQSAMTIASVLYHLAMRDEMLPRFPTRRCRRCRRVAGADGEPTWIWLWAPQASGSSKTFESMVEALARAESPKPRALSLYPPIL